MPDRVIHIDSLADPRIAPYLNLKDRELAREGGRFIAEGELVVRRLLDSRISVESLLLAEPKVPELAPLVPQSLPIYSAPAHMVNQIVGFKFHSGVMAVGIRPPKLTLAKAAESWTQPRLTLTICPEISNTDNLGSLIRISSGFGIDAMILGENCCDPFYRQSIRVSMGSVFRLPIVQSENLLDDLQLLRQQYRVQMLATVLAETAEPLAHARRPQRIGVLFGNEAQGLRPQHIAASDRRITIPMQLGTDSLNVSVAAGIVLYHFTQYV